MRLKIRKIEPEPTPPPVKPVRYALEGVDGVEIQAEWRDGLCHLEIQKQGRHYPYFCGRGETLRKALDAAMSQGGRWLEEGQDMLSRVRDATQDITSEDTL